MKLACVAIVKDEAAHIAEWVAYQFALGFDTVLLFDNLSTDLTVANARALARTQDVRVLDWPLRGPDYQLRAYAFAVRHLQAEFDWVAFFDADEFLVLDPGLTLRDCLAARADAAAVVVNWAVFGAAGHRARPAGLSIEAYTYRAAQGFHANQHVKSIIQPARMEKVENPHSFIMDGRIANLSGETIEWHRPGILHEGAQDFRRGKLHHYFTRSWQDWHEKLRRGYPGFERRVDEFAYYDVNDVFDDGAARLAPAVRAVLAGEALPKPAAATPEPELFGIFESIGSNCEFAFVQRHYGVDKLSLLKWFLSPPSVVAKAFKEDFAGLGAPDTLLIRVNGSEYMIHDQAYGFVGHSWVNTSSTGIDAFKDETAQRLQFLRRKFLADLRNEKLVYVYKQTGTVCDVALMLDIASCISAAGDGILFWVGEAGICHKPAGSVERIAANFICGYVAKLAAHETPHAFEAAGWLDICRKARALVEDIRQKVAADA